MFNVVMHNYRGYKRLRVESDASTRSSPGSRWSLAPLELRPPALEAAGRATSAWEVVAIRPAQRLGSPWSLLLLRRLGLGQPLRVHRLPYIFPKNVHMSKRNASDKNIRHFQLFSPGPCPVWRVTALRIPTSSQIWNMRYLNVVFSYTFLAISTNQCYML